MIIGLVISLKGCGGLAHQVGEEVSIFFIIKREETVADKNPLRD